MKKIAFYLFLLVGLLLMGGLAYQFANHNQLKVDFSSKDQNSYQSQSKESTHTPRAKEETSNTAESTTEHLTSEEVSSQEIGEKEGNKGFNLETVYFKDSQGETIHLPEKFGKPMIINVWASWCPPCRIEMPYFQSAWEDYGDQIDFYMVNATHSQPGETEDKVFDYVTEMELTLPVYFDSNFSTMMGLQATFLPATIFINDSGDIIDHHIGLLEEDQLIEKIKDLI